MIWTKKFLNYQVNSECYLKEKFKIRKQYLYGSQSRPVFFFCRGTTERERISGGNYKKWGWIAFGWVFGSGVTKVEGNYLVLVERNVAQRDV